MYSIRCHHSLNIISFYFSYYKIISYHLSHLFHLFLYISYSICTHCQIQISVDFFLEITRMKKKKRERVYGKYSKEIVPWAGILEEFASGREDNEGNISITENREFLSLFEQPSASLRERYLPRRGVIDLLYLNLLPRHSQIHLKSILIWIKN